MDSSLPLKKSQPVWQGWVLALITTVLFSLVPPITKALINDGLEPTNLLVIRYVLSSVLLFTTIGLTQPQNLRVDIRGLGFCFLCGFLYAGTAWTFTLSLTRLSTSIAAMILSIAPLLTFLLLMTRGERPTQRMLLRFALSFIGVYLLLGPGGSVDAVGVILVFLCCTFYAAYMVTLQWFLKNYIAQTSVLYIIASLAFFVLIIWFSQEPSIQSLSPKSWLLMIFLIIGCTYIAQLCLLKAVRILGSGQMSLLNSLEILLTLIWSAIFLTDRLSLLQWVGGGLILVGMMLAFERFSKKEIL
jgi:drug/metabolite transporter (DMT)-like permease